MLIDPEAAATTSVGSVDSSFFSAARPCAGSVDTIMRSMPYSEVSAGLSATILTPPASGIFGLFIQASFPVPP